MEKFTFKNPTIEIISFKSDLYTFEDVLATSGDHYEIRIPTGNAD